MKLARREFIVSGGAALASTALPAASSDRLLRLGVLSDVHVFSAPDIPFSHPGFPFGRGSVAPLERALEYFRSCRVDAVLITGDIAENGVDTQLKAAADAFERVFPGGRGENGAKVERLFLYGNHDCGLPFSGGYGKGFFREKLGSQAAFSEYAKKHAVRGREREAWDTAFGEEWRPVQIKTVKGVPFILASWGHGEAEAAAVIEKNLPGMDPRRPFFYCQHPYLRGTNFGDWGFDPDSGLLTKLLSRRAPNAVAVTGHTHYPLTDERCLWQGGFTALSASTLAYSGVTAGFENTFPLPSVKRPLQMPQIGGLPEGQQGMVVDVYADRLRIARREFVHGGALAPDWDVPLPDKGSAKRMYPVHGRSIRPADFTGDETVSCRRIRGKDRSGRQTEQLEVSFPAPPESDVSRVYAYSVAVETESGGAAPLPEKRVLGEFHFLPSAIAAKRARKRPPRCVFAVEELPLKTRYRFAVRAVDFFGNCGKPVRSRFFGGAGPEKKENA